MLTVDRLKAKPTCLEDEFYPPLCVVVCFPSAGNSPRKLPFQFPRILRGFFKKLEEARLIFLPRVYAPHMSQDQILSVLRSADDGFSLEEWGMRLPTFQLASWPSQSGASAIPLEEALRLHVVHCFGATKSVGTDLAYEMADDCLLPSALCDLLVQARTRLLVLHHRDQAELDQTLPFAQQVVAKGGPPVLLIADDERPVLEEYLRGLYETILRNRNLDVAAITKSDQVSARLVLGEKAEQVLRLEHGVEAIRSAATPRIAQLSREIKEIKKLTQLYRRLLPASMHSELSIKSGAALRGISKDLELAKNAVARSQSILKSLHLHRIGNVAKTSLLHRSFSSLQKRTPEQGPAEDAASLAGWEKFPAVRRARLRGLLGPAQLGPKLRSEIENPRRVLNVGVVLPRGSSLDAGRPAFSNRTYSILVDVGPRWNKQRTLVAASKGSPEDSLPPMVMTAMLSNCH